MLLTYYFNARSWRIGHAMRLKINQMNFKKEDGIYEFELEDGGCGCLADLERE